MKLTVNPVRAGLLLVVGGLALAAGAVLSGAGRDPGWLPPAAARPPVASKHTTAQALPVVELNSLADAWQKPLFSTDRSPDQAVQGPGADLAGLVLTGVMINGDLKLALLRDASGHGLKVAEGQALPNGWTLQQLSPLAAQFVRQGQTRSLRLPAPRLPAPSRAAMLTLPPVTAP